MSQARMETESERARSRASIRWYVRMRIEVCRVTTRLLVHQAFSLLVHQAFSLRVYEAFSVRYVVLQQALQSSTSISGLQLLVYAPWATRWSGKWSRVFVVVFFCQFFVLVFFWHSIYTHSHTHKHTHTHTHTHRHDQCCGRNECGVAADNWKCSLPPWVVGFLFIFFVPFFFLC